MTNYDPNAPGGPGYPPPPPQQEAPRRKGGCFRWIGIATVAFVGLIVLIAVVAITSGGGDDDDDASTSRTEAGETTDEPLTNSGNEENPPPEDIELAECGPGVGNPAGGSFIGAAGTITNHSSEPSSYVFTVEFVTPDGTRYAESPGSASAVAPDQTAEWSAPTVEEARPDTECRVTQVDRFAS
jgi:hypothetical protein